MDGYLRWVVMAGLAGSPLVVLGGCAAPPAKIVVAPAPAPDAAAILQVKKDAFDQGVAEGRRLQARRDAAALAAAQAALAAAQAKPACPAAAPVTPQPPAPLPSVTPAPNYVPAGPAVPLNPG